MSDSKFTTSAKPALRYKDYGHPLWRRALLTREGAVVGALIIVIVVASATVYNFASVTTLSFLLPEVAPILLIALPMTLVIITGEIDLSVASMAGLSGAILGTLHKAGMPVEYASIIALVVGILGGALNGFLVTIVGLPSLAVTIGSLALFRGIAHGLVGTVVVTDFPEYWKDIARAEIGSTGIPNVMILCLVLAIVFAILLHFTPFGRGVFAIGLSLETARFSGVKVERTKLTLFILTGFISALAGIYITLLFSSAGGDNATGMELTVIAAVLLGGVSIFGGRGALHGVIAAVFLIQTLSHALRIAYVTSDVINIITGTLLVASVVSPSFLDWLRNKRTSPGGKKQETLAAAKG
jgi:rhamnose transport system permease protein